MAKQHYALIEKEGCNPLEITATTIGSSTASGLKKKKESSKRAAAAAASDDDVRVELEEIYQTYADIYPNPNLLEEKRQRDTLLQAARAASSFQEETKKAKEKTKPRRGFFTFLFGTRDDDPATKYADDNNNNNKTNGNINGDTSEETDDDDRITYVDAPNELDDGSLCGTRQSLDVSCIPPEVYNVARSHLTSTRTRRENPNALRWGPKSRALLLAQDQQQQQDQHHPDNASSVMFVVVGLGEIAEFGGGGNAPTNNSTSSSSSRILQTSDRDELGGYAERTQQFDLSAVRGTILSQNCVAISWGFLDGITVFYRRKIVLSKNKTNNKDEDDATAHAEGWEAVWWVGPSGPVLDNLTSEGQDLFHDDAEQPGSPLLKISDCVALHVEAPVQSTERDDDAPNRTRSSSRNSSSSSTAIATLVISRLGGYIELVPLPIALWKGPILERENAASSRKGRDRQRQQQSHYATGKNIVSPSNTLALATFDYHLDVQALEVYRTNVNSETIWNNEEYPDGPPAEFLLVASGVSVDGGYGETLTFWAISTLFASSNEEELFDARGNIDFQLHSRLLEAIWTSTGAPVSTFATPGIMSQWRTPRRVELNDTAFESNTNETTNEQHKDSTPPLSKPLAPVTTLSTTAPVVSMKFSDCDRLSGPFLSILDWNGGVQLFDCSIINRLAAQNLTQHEYEQYRDTRNGSSNEQEQQPQTTTFHLVKCVVLRSQIGTALQKAVRIPTVRNLHWLESTGLGTDGTLPSIVFILSRSKKLVVVTFDLPEDNAPTRQIQEPPKSSMISVPFPVSGAAIESLEDNCLSFVSLRIGSSKNASPKTTTRLFKYFVMEQLQPVAIVKTLARESKFEEAIQSASKLSKYEQDELAEVVVSCHRHLWKTKGDIDSLVATNDERYILGEVESICESVNNEFGFSLDDLRALLKLALQIVSSNHEDKKERARKAFVRLGTFELLCRYYESKPSLKQFQKEFFKLNIIDLSLELAKRGDVPALSIVLFRHRGEVHKKLLDILGSLPLAMQSSSFCHLLPVIRNKNFADLFLDSSNQDISELPWSHMPQYVLERYQTSIAFDRFDEMVVLEYNKHWNDGVDECGPSVTLVVEWLVKRAKQMQTFVGNVDDVVNFTEVGMKCSSTSIDENEFDTGISSIQELRTTWRATLSLKRMLLDQAVSIDGDGINTDDLMGMDLVELLDLVLDCGNQSSIIRYRFDEYIQPLVMEMSISSSSDNLDEALAAYCLKESRKCNDLQAPGAKHALASAVAIAEISKASLHKKNRLIKDKTKLIYMVLNVIDEISKNLDEVEFSMNDRREIIESIWSLYETLPARLITPESENEAKLQSLYEDLVGTDILSRWQGCNPFKFFNKRQSGRHHKEPMFQEENCNLLEICKSFTSAITGIASSQNRVALLQDLLCDVQSLNDVVFKNSLDLSTTLCKYLIPTFLEKGYFELVASYLRSDENVVDRKQVIRNVIEYVDEAMFSEGDNMNRITNAIKCQDALEPLLPEIQSLFQSNRRYLDASHFISTVLLDGNLVLSLNPSDLKEMTALDVVETILREYPECIGCRCSQWMNNDYAQDTNKMLRQTETSISVTMEGHEHDELPDLPGGAVFHLATILGLESNMSAVAVKSRVIYYASQSGYYGAGAAIARTLLQNQDFGSIANMALDTIKLDAIANVVSTENYLDLCTKKELCDTALRRFDRKVCSDNSQFFNTILQVSSDLDYITSRFDQEIGILSPERKECLLSRPIARVHDHTFHEYNRDMYCLFKDLGKQSSQGLVHDSLMDALSRFIFYWCIHDSITTKSVVDLRYKADTQENLKFAFGLVLQIPSILTAESCVHELQEIALTQAGRVATEERFEASSKLILPNPDILRHLIARGFTENAARKAATMTGNAGNNEAMAWAVGHAMDPNLNNPLIMLKSSNSKMIDEDSIQVLQKSLIQLSDIVGNPASRSVFLLNLINRFQNDHDAASFPHTRKTKTKSTTVKLKHVQKVTSKPIGQKPQKRIVENRLKLSVNDHSFEENKTIEPVSAVSKQNAETKQIAAKQRRPPPPPPRVPLHTTTDPVSKLTETKSKNSKTTSVGSKIKRNDSSIENGARIIAPKGAGTKASATSFTMDREELKRKGKAALDKLKRGKIETSTGAKIDAVTREEVRIKGQTATTKTVIDREKFLKKGREALNRLRSSSSTTQNKPESKTVPNKPTENRSRLIEEGRQLFKTKQTKTTSASRRATAATRTTPSVRSGQTLRSGLTLSSAPSSSNETRPPPPKPKPQPPKPRAVPTSQPLVSSKLPNSKPRLIVPTVAPPGDAIESSNQDDEDDDAGWDFDDFDNF